MPKVGRYYTENVGKSPIKAKHSDLTRWSDSDFKSKCPACPDGVLLVRRNEKTFKLERLDFCVACGQAFIYTDIATLRKREG